VALVALTGNPAPGTPAGVNYQVIGLHDHPLNLTGRSAFLAVLTGTGVTSANGVGIWSGPPGNVMLLARTGNPAPGTTAGVNYSALGPPTLNSEGRSAFTAVLTGAGVTTDNDSGIWVGVPGAVALLVREGDAAPGTASGVSYSGFLTPRASNAAGRTVFIGVVSGPGITDFLRGLWSGGPGSLTKIFCQGDPAPGAGVGTVFSDPGIRGVDDPYAINDRGEVIFFNRLTGPNVTSANDGSLWFSDAAGNLSLIVREGTPFNLSSGGTHTLFSLVFKGGSGDEDGLPCGFNDLGQIAFQDGVAGIFIATPARRQFGNISTRLRVETGDNALIGGFIVTGTQPKKVILRAIGPSLPLAGALADPILELRNSSGGLILSNNNWRSDQEAEIIATTIPPNNDLESAIVATLPANNSQYTAIVRGVNNGTGIGVVEAYDLNRTVDSKLANISTRGFVQTGDDVMIGGLIVVGESSTKVIMRAIGPSLSIPGKMADPTLELRDGNGALFQANDNWRTGGQEAEIIATTIPPSNNLESAIVRTLNPGNYTAIMRGVNNGTGIGVVEAYDLGPP